jgi:hypothetical protein
VQLTPSAAETLDRIYSPIRRAGLRELAHYSAEQLNLITEFLRRGRDMQLAQADRIRALADD